MKSPKTIVGVRATEKGRSPGSHNSAGISAVLTLAKYDPEIARQLLEDRESFLESISEKLSESEIAVLKATSEPQLRRMLQTYQVNPEAAEILDEYLERLGVIVLIGIIIYLIIGAMQTRENTSFGATAQPVTITTE